MPFCVTDIQPTPNPNAVKFVLDRRIVEQSTSFLKADDAAGYPVAEKLFLIPGVSSLLFLGDFITVNKQPEAAWSEITSRVKKVLTEA